MSSQLQLATNGFESTRLEFDLWPTSPPCAEARRVPGCKGLWSMCGQSRSYPGCPCQQPWREPTRLFWWLIHKTPMWMYNSLQEGQNRLIRQETPQKRMPEPILWMGWLAAWPMSWSWVFLPQVIRSRPVGWYKKDKANNCSFTKTS